MSNTVHHIKNEREQFRGLFQMSWCVKGTIDFDSIASNGTGEEIVSVPGVVPGDMVIPSFDGDTEDVIMWCHVPSADTVHIHAHNTTGGPVDLASMTFRVIVLRPVHF